MDNKPLVSVILPNYNHAAYLQQRIESVLQQTFDNFELILLDDCSTDNSRQVLSLYRHHPKVSHLLFNEQNSGSTFIQWSKGLSLARGSYIWIAESDDFADPLFLELTIGELEKNDNATLVFTGSQMVDEGGQPLALDWDRFSADMPFSTLYRGKEFARLQMLRNNSIYNASMVVFRKSFFMNIPDAYQQYHYCGDWLFWAEIGMQGDVIRINRKLNSFRQHACKVSVGAEREGLSFTEGCGVIAYLVDKLGLSLYQKLVISGRIHKRLLDKKNNTEGFRHRVLNTHRRLFIGGKWAILVYEFDKLISAFRLM